MVSVEEGSPSRDPRGPTRFLLRPSSVVFSLTCVLFMYLYVASRESSLPLPRPSNLLWLSPQILFGYPTAFWVNSFCAELI